MMRASMPPADGTIFCACAPGLEAVLAAELLGAGTRRALARWGRRGARRGRGRARLPRVADRRLGAAPAVGGRSRGAARARSAPRRVARATRRSSSGPGAGARQSPSSAAGAPLFRRGWRARIGAAPLRETLAAGILLSCGWQGDRPFLDPMCGSGTIAIEAALVAARRAPGLGRTFAFEGFPGHDAAGPSGSARASRRSRGPSPSRCTRPIGTGARCGSRRRTPPPRASRTRSASCARTPAAAEPPAGAGLCAVNPPYGVRLDRTSRAPGVRSRRSCRASAAGDVAILGPDRGYERLLAVPPTSALPVRNGGIACRLLRLSP